MNLEIYLPKIIERKLLKKKVYEIENKKNLSKLEEEKINEYHTELIRILNKKEKYRYHDRDDPDYYGIRDIEVLLREADEKNYCKSILVKSAFKGNYKKSMKAEETEIKIYQ